MNNVVVRFCPWFKFYFLLFLVITTCDNEFETKEIQFKARIKLNNNMLASNWHPGKLSQKKNRCRGYVESSPLTDANEMAAGIEVGISQFFRRSCN